MESYEQGAENPADPTEILRRLAQDPAAAAREYRRLLDALADPDAPGFEWAVSALEDGGPPPSDAVPELIRRMRRAEGDAAYWTATLLGRLGPKAAESLDCLRDAQARAVDKPLAQRIAWAIDRIAPS